MHLSDVVVSSFIWLSTCDHSQRHVHTKQLWPTRTTVALLCQHRSLVSIPFGDVGWPWSPVKTSGGLWWWMMGHSSSQSQLHKLLTTSKTMVRSRRCRLWWTVVGCRRRRQSKMMSFNGRTWLANVWHLRKPYNSFTFCSSGWLKVKHLNSYSITTITLSVGTYLRINLRHLIFRKRIMTVLMKIGKRDI